MPEGVHIVIRSNRIASVVVKLSERTEETIDAVAGQIQSRAASIAPVDTGSLRASIYRSNGDDSDYRDKVNAARGLNDGAVIVPEVNPDLVISPSGDSDASYMVVVGPAVQHGAIQEFGTAFTRAQPFLLPAALGLTEEFVTQMERVADGL